LKKEIILIALILTLISINIRTANASICKELTHSTCNKIEECRWINRYKRADGKSVKAYCRKSNTKSKAHIESIRNTANHGHYRNYEDRWILEK